MDVIGTRCHVGPTWDENRRGGGAGVLPWKRVKTVIICERVMDILSTIYRCPHLGPWGGGGTRSGKGYQLQANHCEWWLSRREMAKKGGLSSYYIVR